jgi:hypothetical protein
MSTVSAELGRLGGGQCILNLTGVGGTGKSRQLRELKEQAGERHRTATLDHRSDAKSAPWNEKRLRPWFTGSTRHLFFHKASCQQSCQSNRGLWTANPLTTLLTTLLSNTSSPQVSDAALAEFQPDEETRGEPMPWTYGSGQACSP